MNHEIDNTIYEMCPYCDLEVELKDEFKLQRCPECGELIAPCSICPVQCNTKCPLGV